MLGFPSDEVNGAYLACRVILGEAATNRQGPERLRTDYLSPFEQDRFADAAKTQSVERPGIWVMQVGKGAILPVAMLSTATGEETTGRADQAYTWRLDRAWNAQREANLADRARRLGLAPDREPLPPADSRPSALRLHGPSPVVRSGVAAWSLFILLLAAAALFRKPADPAASLLDEEFRTQAQIELGWLAIVLIVLQLVAAAPLLVADWLSHDAHSRWATSSVIWVAAVLSAVAVVFLSVATFRLYASDAFRRTADYRRARDEHFARKVRPAEGGGWMDTRVQRGLSLLKSFSGRSLCLWELWSVPVLCLAATAGIAAGVAVAHAAAPHQGELVFLGELAGTPWARLCPLVPLAAVLLGFGFVFGGRFLRSRRSDGRRIKQFVAWRQIKGRSQAVRDAADALDGVDRQAAVPRYVLAGVAWVLAVVGLGYVFWGHTRLTQLPDGIEWSLRIALLRWRSSASPSSPAAWRCGGPSSASGRTFQPRGGAIPLRRCPMWCAMRPKSSSSPIRLRNLLRSRARLVMS